MENKISVVKMFLKALRVVDRQAKQDFPLICSNFEQSLSCGKFLFTLAVPCRDAEHIFRVNDFLDRNHFNVLPPRLFSLFHCETLLEQHKEIKRKSRFET